MALIFSRNNGLHSRIVRLFTRSEWSHVEVLLINSELIIGAEPGEGVIVNDLDREPPGSTVAVGVVIDRLVPNPERATDFLIAQIGKKYDWTGLIGWLFKGRNWQEPNKWFCSELVAAMLIAGGHEMKVKTGSVSPQDLWDMTRSQPHFVVANK
ncbi:hypothetical protein [Chitinibacter tainanensis]|uniref:hypothetical protein n=1 Tax=Chitinibacter tainanensis TaxID=230667 RepID=UPI00048DD7C9|nr:hypothetical protein [Chitinibacter tainanensis]